MKVVILCGGQGTRLREETEVKPKPMVAVGPRPIVWHIMKTYAHAGFDSFVLCLGYKGEVIKDYFVNYRVRSRDCTVRLGDGSVDVHADGEEESWTVTLADTGIESGTGDRIGRVRRYLDADPDDVFLATYGDALADLDVRDVLATHRRAGRLATALAVRPSSRFGEMAIDGALVSVFQEKPQVDAGWINGGFFVFDKRVLDRLAPGVGSLEEGLLVELARERQLAVHQHAGFWQCMDNYREMKLLQSLWEQGRAPWAVWDR
ncbi:MAG: glucose-1-phosphate cytidylyltransferase [Myxococcota bacterium]